jgi:hypothetical protein
LRQKAQSQTKTSPEKRIGTVPVHYMTSNEKIEYITKLHQGFTRPTIQPFQELGPISGGGNIPPSAYFVDSKIDRPAYNAKIVTSFEDSHRRK